MSARSEPKVIDGGKRTLEVVIRPTKGTVDTKKPSQPKPGGLKVIKGGKRTFEVVIRPGKGTVKTSR